ncbi:MAG: hypothetical protein ACJAZ9_001770 [Neolewinella sp.]
MKASKNNGLKAVSGTYLKVSICLLKRAFARGLTAMGMPMRRLKNMAQK